MELFVRSLLLNPHPPVEISLLNVATQQSFLPLLSDAYITSCLPSARHDMMDSTLGCHREIILMFK